MCLPKSIRVITLGLFFLSGSASLPGAVQVGSGPAFSYRYSPRQALGADANAVYDRANYYREPPVNLNCSFLIPSGTTNLSQGTVTYLFQSDPKFAIQHVALYQKATLYTSGSISGDYQVSDEPNFQRFFGTPRYAGSPFTHERRANLRHVNSSNLTVRYTLVLSNGVNVNVQFLRDCDDATTAFTAQGTVITQAEVAQTRLLVPARATWKYLDDGSNQGTDWRLPDFDDTPWPSGPAELGYGDADEATTIAYGPDPGNKRVTTYFRHAFFLNDPGIFESLSLGLLRDDGAVIYLNGQEVLRVNLPAGTVGYRTYATVALGDPEETTFAETEVSPTPLRPGLNVLAAEVHQATAGSSDLSFDLDLAGTIAKPRLYISRLLDCVVLAWDREGFVLEEAIDAGGPWSEVSGAPESPYTICGNIRQAFYQLKVKPPF